MGLSMRGDGELQQKIREKNIKKILFEIKLASDNNRFCTVNQIHKWTKLNHTSIRNHLKTLLDSGKIIEYSTYNNARGFVISSVDKKLTNDNLLQKFEDNTFSIINDQKFPHKLEEDINYFKNIGVVKSRNIQKRLDSSPEIRKLHNFRMNYGSQKEKKRKTSSPKPHLK